MWKQSVLFILLFFVVRSQGAEHEMPTAITRGGRALAAAPFCSTGPKSEFQKGIEARLLDSLQGIVQKNPGQTIRLPAPEVAERLGLAGQNQLSVSDVLNAIRQRGQDVLAAEDRIWLQLWAQEKNGQAPGNASNVAPLANNQTPPGGGSQPQPSPSLPPGQGGSSSASDRQSISNGFRIMAEQKPGMRLNLQNGLFRKFGFMSPIVTPGQVADALLNSGVFDRLDGSEKSRLSKAIARIIGPSRAMPSAPHTVPEPGFGPSPDPGSNHSPGSPGNPGPPGNPKGIAGLKTGAGFILDERVRAGQQSFLDCWAHSFGVALQLALLGNADAPIPSRGNAAYLGLANQPSGNFETTLAQYGSRILGEQARRQHWYGARGFLPPGPPLGNRFGIGNGMGNGNRFGIGNGNGGLLGLNGSPSPLVDGLKSIADRLKGLLDKARSVTSQLSRMTGGGPTPIIPTVIGFASRLGWNQVVAMKAVAGQDRMGSQQFLRNIIDGMKRGVRFSGYFGSPNPNNSHAMAVVGADVNTNSVIVTDSMRNGQLLKIPLGPGQGHIDGLVAVVRRDLSDGVNWLNQQPSL